MKVYVLTVDEYEDEEIVGVFSSMEKLNEFKNRFPMRGRGYNTPKQFELNEIPERPNNKFVYNVSYNCKEEISAFKTDFTSMRFIGLLSGKEDNPITYVWASDKEEAIENGKIFFGENGVLK